MNNEMELYNKISDLLDVQLFAVLATSGSPGPHSVIVSFVSVGGIKELFFLTPRQTRKYHNLKENSTVSLFMDNRSNKISDTQRTIGVEAVGLAEEVSEEDRKKYFSLFLEKYPAMEDFASSPTTAVIRLRVKRYEVVQHFQNVTVLELI